MATVARRKITRRPREERVEAICAAARAAFAARGYEGAVVADIAAAAGVVEGTVYKHFANKRELLHKVMEQWYVELVADVRRALEGIRDPEEKLRCVIRRHLQTVKAEPALCRVFFREIRAYDGYRESAVFALNREYTAITLGVLRDGVEAGVFRDDLPLAMIRDAIFGGLEHHVWLYLADGRALDFDAATELYASLMMRGIGAPAGSDRGRVDALRPIVRRLEAVAERLERSGG